MSKYYKYGYRSSYGKGYRIGSGGGYKGFGRKNNKPVLIIVIILILLLAAGGVIIAGACLGWFGDALRIGGEKKEAQSSVIVAAESKEESSKPQQSSKQEKEIEGKWEENVFVYGTKGFEPFNADDKSAKEYAEALKAMKKDLGGKVKVYTMLAPSHSFTGLPEKYMNIGSDEKKSIEKTYSQLGKDIKSINVCNTLEKHKNEYIYFGTDTNWTGLGAYYAYQDFCKAAGVKAVGLEGLSTGKISGFRGSLHAATVTEEKPNGSEILDQNPDTVIYYKVDGYCRLLESGESEDREVPMIAEFASGSNAYSAFIWGNNPYMKIETQLDTGRKLCIIKDSFGCAFAPFTAASFDEVFIVDPAYYDGNIVDYIKENNYTDVLVLNSTSTANTAERVGELKTIL